MQFNTKSRRKSIKVIVSDEERSLLETKANFYGYKTIASYIRDSAIYEKVTHIDLKSKNEIYEVYSNNTKEFKFNKVEEFLIENRKTKMMEKVLSYVEGIVYKKVFGLKAGIVFISYEYRNEVAQYLTDMKYDIDFVKFCRWDKWNL